MTSGARNGHWKGGRVRQADGYVYTRMRQHPFASNGYVLEHRLIMEHLIGRYLHPGETVHHKNGDKQDNRPENLELWRGRHGAGSGPPHCPTCRCKAERKGKLQ
jgi:hypothetical protein